MRWDQLTAETPITAQGDYGGPATFEAEIAYGGVPGPGRVEAWEFSAADGSVIATTAVGVTLAGYPGDGYIELPAPLSEVTLPVKLLARAGRPREQVQVTLSWESGERLARVFTTLEGLDGRGLLIVPLDSVEPGFAHPLTQRGWIEISTMEGSPLAQQPVHILHPEDPGTLGIQVTWTRGEALAPQTLRIPRTPGVGRAALEALIWGPVPGNPDGYGTYLLPTPEQILTYPGRGRGLGRANSNSRADDHRRRGLCRFLAGAGRLRGGRAPAAC